MSLYIIQGFIASGKTTFSKKLSKEKNAIHLNSDEMVTKMYDKEYYMKNWDTCFDNALTTMWEKTKEYLLDNKDVILDMGFWKKADREYARNIAKECGVECIHYYLYVPDEILKERIINDRPSEWASIHLKNFDHNKSKFEEPDSENVIVIHNY